MYRTITRSSVKDLSLKQSVFVLDEGSGGYDECKIVGMGDVPGHECEDDDGGILLVSLTDEDRNYAFFFCDLDNNERLFVKE